MTDKVQEKYRQVEGVLRRYKRVVVGYSGGVDSTLLLKAAIDCLGRENVLACLGVGPVEGDYEYRLAVETAKQMGAVLREVPRGEIAGEFRANTPRRCYHCKYGIFEQLKGIASAEGYDAVLCGSNADDLSDYRPGNQATAELGVLCPLEQAGLSKGEIRELAKGLGLSVWDKPSVPCLASRIQYGVEITAERLGQVEQAESYLRAMGLVEFRVRHHGSLARIEATGDWIAKLSEPGRREQVVGYFRSLGFKYVSLDLQGFRSGSGNEIL